ncbi:MAG: NAD(P)-dependent glycerol-1-phosphate dehydrogenase [Candidatus Bathyarchaeia archaeon]
MELPREVIVGSRILPLVGETCRRLGFTSSSLVLIGPSTYDVAGKVVIESLQDAGFKVAELIVEKSGIATVESVRKGIRESKPSVVLGVGGGKVIDVAKLGSAEEGVPFVSVPTAASHDGIASPRASISDSDKSLSVEAQAPVAIIADTHVIIRSPYRLTASGCGDIIAKYTSVRDWRLAHKLKGEYYGEYAASLALMCARLVMRNAELIRRNDEEGLRTVLEALISCGVAMGIAGSSRPCSGSEHLFSHALDRIAPKSALHGEQCGVGAIMMAYLHGANWKLVRDSLRTIGAPTTAKELGIEPSYVIEALTLAHKIRPERYTILGENGLTRSAAERLASATAVI